MRVDEKNKMTYSVLAYRELSQRELLGVVRVFLGNQKKQPKNKSITITTGIA